MAVLLTGLLGVLVSPVVIAAVRTAPDRKPLREGFGPLGELPAWAIAVAALNGVLWGLAANRFTPPWYVVTPFLVLFSALLAVAVIDLQVFRIPDRITFPVLGTSAVLLAVVSYALERDIGDALTWMRYALIGMVSYFVLLFIPHLISPRGMGFGDVKLALVMGLHLGWLGRVGDVWYDAVQLTIMAFFIGCVVGVVVGLGYRLVRRAGEPFPFGPALATAAVFVALTFENFIVN